MSDRWDVSREVVVSLSGPELTALALDGLVVVAGPHRREERLRHVSLFQIDGAAVRHVNGDKRVRLVVFDHRRSRDTDDKLIAVAREVLAA